jgi:hypothetical protein
MHIIECRLASDTTGHKMQCFGLRVLICRIQFPSSDKNLPSNLCINSHLSLLSYSHTEISPIKSHENLIITTPRPFQATPHLTTLSRPSHTEISPHQIPREPQYHNSTPLSSLLLSPEHHQHFVSCKGIPPSNRKRSPTVSATLSKTLLPFLNTWFHAVPSRYGGTSSIVQYHLKDEDKAGKSHHFYSRYHATGSEWQTRFLFLCLVQTRHQVLCLTESVRSCLMVVALVLHDEWAVL